MKVAVCAFVCRSSSGALLVEREEDMMMYGSIHHTFIRIYDEHNKVILYRQLCPLSLAARARV
jgi:hypothetical protein